MLIIIIIITVRGSEDSIVSR